MSEGKMVLTLSQEEAEALMGELLDSPTDLSGKITDAIWKWLREVRHPAP